MILTAIPLVYRVGFALTYIDVNNWRYNAISKLFFSLGYPLSSEILPQLLIMFVGEVDDVLGCICFLHLRRSRGRHIRSVVKKLFEFSFAYSH